MKPWQAAKRFFTTSAGLMDEIAPTSARGGVKSRSRFETSSCMARASSPMTRRKMTAAKNRRPEKTPA